MPHRLRGMCVMVMLAFAMAMPARASDVRVVSAEAPRDALEAIAAQFEKDTGHKVTFAFMTAGQARAKVEAGEPVDVAITSPAMIAELLKSGKIAGSTNLGRIGLAVAVRDGAPTPDLSTLDAFTNALLDAKSVAFTNPAAGGTAGLYFAGLLKRLAIEEAVTKKAVYA